MPAIPLDAILNSGDESIYDVRTKAPGPPGALPLTPEIMREYTSGDLFGWTMDAAMGWDPSNLGSKEVMILSTHGGVRAPDGAPVALGLHTGHWEVGLLVEAVAEELKRLGAIPFASSCTDPCDGRTQGTAGMFESLAYRNDAATIFRRHIRSLPTRSAVVGVAACDKGVPAMMMALAAMGELPSVLVPGGVMLPAEDGWNASSVQSIGPQYLHGQITLEEAASVGCHSCASPGGGCQFLGTAATSQVVAEALGMTLTHAALSPSGQPIWTDMARRSARAVMALEARGLRMKEILTEASIHNALVTHAAFGGSTNLVLHIAAVAHAAGLRRPVREDWARVNAGVPRLVDVLPNGPRSYATLQVFLAGGVPEVMLHLRRAGLLDTGVLTVSGETLGAMLDWWEKSERRAKLRALLQERDGVDPNDVIMDPETSRRRGITSTVCFPTGNLAPEGSVIKSTAIDPSVVDADGVFRKVGPARVFFTEAAVIAAIKSTAEDRIRAGDVIVMAGRGPLGAGMEEAHQLTAALKYLDYGKHVALITDSRFSGVSTGACIGHVSPEALAGGPLGKVREGDTIEIIVDRNRLEGSVDMVGCGGRRFGAEEGARVLASRPPHQDLVPDARLSDDTRLWAALQDVSGGPWGGCVYDVDAIVRVLEAGKKALLA